MTVEELLKSRGIPYFPKGKDFVISCLNPEHDDSNPSMRVDQVDGRYHCFSCGYKGRIFEKFNVSFDLAAVARKKLKEKIQDIRRESVGLDFPNGYVPYMGNHRGIKPETYKKFEAFKHIGNLEQDRDETTVLTRSDFADRIVFPVRDRSGRISSFVGRGESPEVVPKYKNYPSGAKMSLFPLYPKIETEQNSIILVEGLYDVLNLHDKGLKNALCCFGTRNIDTEKLSLLKMEGITKVYIFFDNDEAGQTGAEKVKELCTDLGLVGKVISFGSKEVDPGSLSQSQIDKLKRYLYA
jgi:DNA primase